MKKTFEYMPIKKFRDMGLLQEVNRKFFHPFGLALEVEIDWGKDKYWLSGIRDYSQDPEGVRFGVNQISKKKVKQVESLWKEKASQRKKVLGYVIQPFKKIEKPKGGE